jgi:tryptophan halogenase
MSQGRAQKVKVVIAGGGTAGWVTAAALSAHLGPLLDITLIESDAIGSIGVGEATIPTHVTFHQLIGIDEREFMRETQATFKLAIAFENWGALGDRYFHSFGQIGKSTWMTDFHSMWRQAQAFGFGGDLSDYSFETQAAEAAKFYKSDKSSIGYAYHLDSGLYAKYLRTISEGRGVKRIEGKILEVKQNTESGDITSLKLESGQDVSGDFFIDCTGFKALLIGQTLGVNFVDWKRWLPMDRAIAVQTGSAGPLLPYTKSIAHEAGWQWRIPLQHRVGNGHVYSSDYMGDDKAHEILMQNLDSEPVIDPRVIRFRTGRLERIWEKNCIAIGLSGGFLEPLESTSIHLIQIIATRLIKMFPFSRSNIALARHFNTEFTEEFDRIRDFIILHYIATQRDDSQFWLDRQTLNIPTELAERIALYKESGLVYQHDADIFRKDSWHQVLRGQGIVSEGFHFMGKMLGPEKLNTALSGLKNNIDKAVHQMPSHEDFIRQYCSASTV